jgi:hypothetical protein
MKPNKVVIEGVEYFRKDEIVQCLSDIVEECIRQAVVTGDLLHHYNAGSILMLKKFFEIL